MHRSIVKSALAGIVAVAAVSATPATSKLPSEVSCGDTIVADTILDRDLVDCPSNGIVIGADNITLDLNGHTITGDGERFKGCGSREFCDTGVVNDGHDGITLRDGSVRGFFAGVFVGKARDNRVLRVSSSGNKYFGFVIAESVRSVVRDSSGNNNPVPDGDGIGVFASRHLRIVNNSFRRNDLGMHVKDSTDIRIEGNRFERNAHMGIVMEADRNEVRGNHCARNRDHCIAVGGSRNVIVGNRANRDNAGIAIDEGRSNVVARNVVLRARRDGIRLGWVDPPIGGIATVIRSNVVRDSGRDAFVVSRYDRHSVLRGNLAIAAGDDGFDVNSPSAKLRNNRAIRNAELGIEAVHGVIDGGGNTARHNRDWRRCTNISCR
jgi:parallel beta-helix repeat protein